MRKHKTTPMQIPNLHNRSASVRLAGLAFLMLAPFATVLRADENAAPADKTSDPAHVSLEALVDEVEAPPAVEPAATSPRADKTLEEADALFKERRYTEAIQKLESGLRRHRRDPRIYRMLGRVCFEQGSQGRARSHFTRALELAPDDRLSHCLVGRIAEQAGEKETALLEYRKALLCSPDNQALGTVLTLAWIAPMLEADGYTTAAIDAWSQLGVAVGGADDESRQDFLRLVGGDWSPESTALHICNAYEALGDDEQAISWLKTAINKADDDAQRAALQARFAALTAKVGRPEESLEISRKLLAQLAAQPKDADVAIRAAFDPIRKSYESLDKADVLRADLAAVADGHPVLLNLLADLSLEANDNAAARDALTKALDAADPAAASKLRMKLAQISLADGDPVGALQAIADVLRNDPAQEADAVTFVQSLVPDATALKPVREKVDVYLADAPKDGVVRFLMARMCAGVGLKDDAESYDEAALDAETDFLPVYLALGDEYVSQFRWDDATSMGRRALKAGFDTGPVHRLAARAHDGLDEVDEAVKEYKNAIELDRQDAASMVDLAKLWTRTGDGSLSAQRYLKSATTADPNNAEAYALLIKSYLFTPDPSMTGETRIQLATDTLDQMRRFCADTVDYRMMRAWYDLVLGNRDKVKGPAALDGYVKTLHDIQAAYPDDARPVADEADLYYQKTDFEKAVQLAERALQRDPADAHALEILFQSYQSMLDYDKAVTTLEQLLKMYPNRPFFRRRYAHLFLVKQDWDRAIALMDEMLEAPAMKDEQQRIRAELVNALDLQGRKTDAIATAKQYYDDAPDDFATRNLYLSALKAVGRNDEAVTLAESLYESDPDNDNLRQLLIGAYWSGQKFDLALARLVSWIAEDPRNADWNDLLYRTLRVSGADDSAIELARNFEYIDPVSGGIRLVMALLDADRNEEAVTTARNLAQTQGNLRAFWYPSILYQAKRYQEAVDILTGLAQQRLSADDKKIVLRQLSFCYQQMEQDEAAQNALEELLADNPGDYEIGNDLGYTWADAGLHLDKAEDLIRLAVGERPRNPAYLDSLGWVRYKKGDFASARDWLRRATKARATVSVAGNYVLDSDGLSPADDPVIFDHLGDAEYQLGEKDAAREAWETAVRLYDRGLALKRSRDDSEIIASVREKLAALDDNRPPPVAAVVGDEAADSNDENAGGE